MLKEIADKLARLPQESVHQWLRDSTQLATEDFGPIPFVEAEAEAKAKGWELVDGWQNGTAILRRYRITETTFWFGDVPADAYLFYSSRNRKEGSCPFIATDVCSIEVGLNFNFGRPYQDVLAEAAPSKPTVIEHVLNLDEVRRQGLRWPFLRRMRVHYGLRFQFSSDQDHHPSGFFVETEFTANLDRPVGYCHVEAFVESKLDPWRDLAGNALETGYIPQDELSETRARIGTEGWHCTSPEEAAELKRTYLNSGGSEGVIG